MKSIIIPKVDANIEEGTLGAWMVAEGDIVKKGQALVELITDKAVFEIEAPSSGCLRKITVPEKSVVPVGTIVGLIGRPGEKIPDIESENRKIMQQHRNRINGLQDTPAPATRKDTGSDAPPPPPAESAGKGKPRATLAARRLARRKGIALETLQQRTGNSLITVEMVEQADKTQTTDTQDKP